MRVLELWSPQNAIDGREMGKGESLQRLVMQIMLELRQREANFMQRILLRSEPLVAMSQCLALGLSLDFPFCCCSCNSLDG